MQKIWRIKKTQPELQEKLATSLDVHPIISQLLINRGVKDLITAKSYLDLSLSSLCNPYQLADMDKAVQRIKRAISLNENILIYGDYDADGLSSCALLLFVLKGLGAHICHYIPHRMREGYGISNEGIEFAKKNNVRLIITVDCGISSVEEIDHLNDIHIDTIITDHHIPNPERLPRAYAIINPLQTGCTYPYKYLAGVGLAFKLSQALLIEEEELPFEHLDLVALGTVADVSPMTGENRTLVHHGLERLARTNKIGLRSLIESSGLSDKELSTFHLAYILGPRLNAQGRLGSADASFRLLTASDEAFARQLAQTLEEGNRQRRQLENRILKDVLCRIEREVNFKEHRVIVLEDNDWHPGVIGIVASKIAQEFNRPTILISLDGPIGKGSGRSIENFHIVEALENVRHLVIEFGGHQHACGLIIYKDRLAELKDALNKLAHQRLTPDDLIPQIDIDMELPFHLIDEKLVEAIKRLEPFGPSNPQPLFLSLKVMLKDVPRIVGNNHLKLHLSDGGRIFEAIGYNMANSLSGLKMDDPLDIVYSLGMNNWQGEKVIQLEIKDIKVEP